MPSSKKTSKSAPKPKPMPKLPTKDALAQKIKETAENLVVMRKLPAGMSLLDAIRGPLRREDQIVAEFPSDDQLCAWASATLECMERPPKKDEVWLFQYKGGVFPLDVGTMPISEGAVEELPETTRVANQLAKAYFEECRSYIAVPPVAGDGKKPSVVISKPDGDQRAKWIIERFLEPKNAIGRDTVILVDWEGGYYPFAAGEFYAEFLAQNGTALA